MLKFLMILPILLLINSCFSADEDIKPTEVVKAEVSEVKKEVVETEKQAAPATNATDDDKIELMNAPKVAAKKTAPITKELPTEVIATKEMDALMSVENPVSEPQIFIVRDGEVLPEAEASKQPPVEAPTEADDTQIKDFIVNASHLNVRGGPAMNFPVIRVVKQGVKFRSLSIEGIWVQMAKNEYVSLHFLKEDHEEYADHAVEKKAK